MTHKMIREFSDYDLNQPNNTLVSLSSRNAEGHSYIQRNARREIQAVIEEARRVKDKFKEENRGAINIIQK